MALAGCGEDAAQPPSGPQQLEDEVVLGTSSQTWLIVVDSSSTAAANELRRLYAEEFVTYWADATRLCAGDAAAWAPIHRDAVVAYASSDGNARFAGPDETPALTLDRPTTTHAELTTWGDAVSSALTKPPSPDLVAPVPLAALTDSTALLAGLRDPELGRETSMMAALAPREQLVVAVVSASEDASPESPEAYAVVSGEPVGRFAKYFVDAAVAPAVESDDCGVACPATPRFQAWADASDGVPLETWAPGDKGPLSGGLSAPLCTPHCVDAPPEPPANCRLFVFPRDAGVCPAELGWFRPEPPLAGDESSCEVRALDGGALESCRTDLSCADCEPGYCFTDVPDLAAACNAKGKLTFPRVIAGTGPNEPERFRLVCQLD